MDVVVSAIIQALLFLVLPLAWWVLTGTIGVVMGYLNERLAGGSLVPSWILHAAANMLTGCLALAALV